MISPASALDPLVMLAMGIHAQPGVYALLLGSGVSTGAGIPTGWGVVEELTRRAAAARDPGNAVAADQAVADPEGWWAANGDGQPLGYSNLLTALAPTSAARRGLLTSFFEPTEEDAEAGLKVPGPAHRAIAQMAKRGLIRVILTTNFDRLIERALEDVGVSPQVVARPEAVPGLIPLAHAPVTLVKLHGDYADLEMRNTVDELDSYPAEWNTLLDRILDEYGLLICGWSGDWDKALVAALKRAGRRRYPLYWDERGSRRTAAAQLIAQHTGVVVPMASADELFTGLLERLDALDRLSEPPLTTALAIARLKRYLPDPARRIDVHDLVVGTAAQVAAKATEQPLTIPDGITIAKVADVLAGAKANTMPLLHLLVTGVYHDRGREHTDLWVECIQRLLQAKGRVHGSFHEYLYNARHYPALLALRAAGLAAVYTGRDDVLLRLLTEPKWLEQFGRQARIPASQALHEYRVLEWEVINRLPRWEGTRWTYPHSHLLREELREPLREVIPDDDEYVLANDHYEYRVALTQHTTSDAPGAYRAAAGEFIGEWKWDWERDVPTSETDFCVAAEQADDQWPWWSVVGGRDGLDGVLTSLRQDFKKQRRLG